MGDLGCGLQKAADGVRASAWCRRTPSDSVGPWKTHPQPWPATVLSRPKLGGQRGVIMRSERSAPLSTERVERRLTAILAADVAGYSRLMGADEEGTLGQLKAHRRALVDPKIAEHGGRIVKTTGDCMLVEFASVVDALRCAVEVQRGMAERNAQVPQEKRIEFRVGVHQGDIIFDG